MGHHNPRLSHRLTASHRTAHVAAVCALQGGPAAADAVEYSHNLSSAFALNCRWQVGKLARLVSDLELLQFAICDLPARAASGGVS